MKKAIRHLKQADPTLAAIMERTGPCKMNYSEPTFQALVRSIVYQQLHGKAALSIFTRLENALKAGPMTPEAILKLRPQKMRALGLSQGKTTYIRELARATRDGHVQFENLPALSDDEVIQQLTQVKGIGVWTSHMFLMFALRRPDILPVGDLGVRMAMMKAYQLPELPKPFEMERIADPWRPYCSIASWYMWRSLESGGET
jgi:DNA-3-methyladenine glycosylase II